MNEEIMKILKDHGLESLEESTKILFKNLMKALPLIALATENKIDDLFAPALAVIEPKAMELIELINPEDNE